MITSADFEEERWPVAATLFAAAAVACALFAAARRAGWWGAAPVLLWGEMTSLLAAAVVCFGGRRYYASAGWLRYTSARHLALLSSVVVGTWLGSQHASWAALIPVPAFASLLNLHSLRVGPVSERHRPEPAARWNAYVAGGELVGFLAAAAARAIIG